MELIQITFLAIVGVMTAMCFKQTKPEICFFIGFTISIGIFGYALRQLAVILEQMNRLKLYLDGSEKYITILLKVVGITYLCEFGSNLCKDAGFTTVASQIEILGKLSVMFAGLPILFAVIDTIQSFMS